VLKDILSRFCQAMPPRMSFRSGFSLQSSRRCRSKPCPTRNGSTGAAGAAAAARRGMRAPRALRRGAQEAGLTLPLVPSSTPQPEILRGTSINVDYPPTPQHYGWVPSHSAPVPD